MYKYKKKNLVFVKLHVVCYPPKATSTVLKTLVEDVMVDYHTKKKISHNIIEYC